MSEYTVDISEAIVVFLKNYPGKNDEEFATIFGSGDGQAFEQVRAILTETMRLPLDLSGKSLIEIGESVRQVMHERHPELTAPALKKLGNYFTYLVK